MKKLTLVSLILSMILISCKERGEVRIMPEFNYPQFTAVRAIFPALSGIGRHTSRVPPGVVSFSVQASGRDIICPSNSG